MFASSRFVLSKRENKIMSGTWHENLKSRRLTIMLSMVVVGYHSVHVMCSITSISHKKHDQCQQPNRIFRTHSSSELHLNLLRFFFHRRNWQQPRTRREDEGKMKKKRRCTLYHALNWRNEYVYFFSFFLFLNNWRHTAAANDGRNEKSQRKLQNTNQINNVRILCEFWIEDGHAILRTVCCYCLVSLLITNWWMSENL